MDYVGAHHDLNGEDGETGRVATKTTSIAKVVNIVDPMFNSSTIGTAIQVLETLSEVGKTLPFIAPAFILLKIIIDVEKRAQDVDAKCNDLVERITFMLSHLPALQNIEILAATRQVIGRMDEALKEATALIIAYRKQSRVARRLSMSNRDRFSTCAESINNCCRDLLISLQIHQTVQIEILTRDVPVDDGDIAGGAYIEAHGGDDAVLHDRELVSEFARQQHLVMDDSVMEQLNASIADSVKHNHARLENILRNNVSSAIADGLKTLAMGINALEAEQKFHCVQCDKEFTNSTNGPTACSFHRGEYYTQSKKYPCCSNAHPCQFGAHRAKHHCDYPYGLFFPHAEALTHTTQWKTHDEWAKVQDLSLETDNIQQAFVGQLLRWNSIGGRIEENTLLIIVGTVTYQCPYYLNTFTAKELEDASKSVQLTHHTLIFRTSADENEHALAEWTLDASGKISGVRIKAKTSTSAGPWVRVCPIDIATCQKSGDVLTVSEGGMWSYTPSSEYVLPRTVTIGPVVKDTQSRSVRTNFKTRTTPSLRVILRSMSDPPLATRPSYIGKESFTGKVSIFNNYPAGSANPVTIAAVSAFYRMVGDLEYLPVLTCKPLNGADVLPVTIEPRQSWLLNFEVVVPRTEEDTKNDWLLTRHRPLRIKLVVEDIEGEQCSLVMEYVHKPFRFECRQESDFAFFFFDEPQTLLRTCIHVGPSKDPTYAIVIGGSYVTVRYLEKLVYQALRSGETEHEMTRFGRTCSFGKWEWKVMALVDLSCRRVYAFKIVMQEGPNIPVKRLGCVGYVLCPSYGKVINEKRPISYATESAQLPPLEPYNLPEYPQDDTFDDVEIPVPSNLTAPISSSGGAVLSADLVNRLTSIDANLTRIAVALEKDLASRSTVDTNLARIATALESLIAAKPVSSNL